MGALYDALVSLSPVQDVEVLDGYRRYESQLETILTPGQIVTYADYINQSGVVRILEEMTPEELAHLPPGMAEIAASIVADTETSMENRRVVALLDQRGEDEVTPDFNPPNANR